MSKKTAPIPRAKLEADARAVNAERRSVVSVAGDVMLNPFVWPWERQQ